MADCIKCKTWNPDDKLVCWRCQTPLPKPEPPRRKRQLSSTTILLVVGAFFLISWLFFQLFVLSPVGR
ncbi:MAG: hypothetical protein WAW03_11015 [Anaerolineae bacterium]|uniref:hypothetical protein n=1 Tax=Candidatus Amarolinea dominans TaxID=3140696 RepID=UPI001DC47286|nr:hypothetical protein [Anaerolineae bacterium]MBK7199108.1 hypothetical protein [Anaerolineae bacterium]MBK9095852.1 hypothetical protein [Anaerolineae bacterium]MBK9230031.1 hypothetical protein [Anaerolineae bacterium]